MKTVVQTKVVVVVRITMADAMAKAVVAEGRITRPVVTMVATVVMAAITVVTSRFPKLLVWLLLKEAPAEIAIVKIAKDRDNAAAVDVRVRASRLPGNISAISSESR